MGAAPVQAGRRNVKKIRDYFAGPRSIWVAVALAVLLGLPTLAMGPMLDDFVMRVAVDKSFPYPGGPRGLWDLYRFADGGDGVREAIDIGLYPWWSSPTLKLAFFRPLSSLWIAFDNTVLVDVPWATHLGTIALYAATVYVVARLYGKLLGGATAGLAALLYAIDDAHALPVVWASNRHALISAFFGFAALLAHVRGSRVSSVGLLAMALAGGESALGVVPYFLAHAVFVDERGRAAASKRLLSHGVVLVAWAALYLGLGYGVHGSAGYVHPLAAPGAFFLVLVERAPQLVLAQLLGPPAEIWALLPPAIRRYAVVGIFVAVLGLGWLIARATRGHRLRAFFAFGALCSIPPLVATFPADRMLLFPGFGAFGLISIAIARIARAKLEGRASRRGLVLAGGAIAVHAILAFLLFFQRERDTAQLFSEGVARGASTLPRDEAVAEQTVMVLVTPDPLMTSYMFLHRLTLEEDVPLPKGARVLSVAQTGTVRIEREGDRALIVRASNGAMFSDIFSSVYRDAPFETGVVHRAGELSATVLELDGGGYPSALRFEWDAPLDSAPYRWVVWRDRGFAEMDLPAIGQKVEVPAVDWMTAFGPGR